MSGMTVAVAGASGFIGRALCERLATDHRVVALSRTSAPSAGGVERRRCDLFSLLDCEHALAGADVAVYLVHSMMPSARLTQASFGDMDLILADNFARAAKRVGVKQIVYLGGVVPEPVPAAPVVRSSSTSTSVRRTVSETVSVRSPTFLRITISSRASTGSTPKACAPIRESKTIRT